MIELAINLGPVLVFFVVGFVVGRIFERRHYKSIREREALSTDIGVYSDRNLPEGNPETISLVHGSVVISHDYFQKIVAGLRMIFGGQVTAYESLLDRARREAVLRMKEQTRDLGGNMVLNTRFTTSRIANGGRSTTGVEVVAYGTALKVTRDL